MIIDNDISKFIIFSEDSLLNALRKISENKTRVIFCVSASGELEGILTDGDVRRWVTTQGSLDTQTAVIKVANRELVHLPVDTPSDEIAGSLSERINVIPLVDGRGHLVAVARRGEPTLKIGNAVIGPASPTFVIAEIGNNHNGSLSLAKELVDLALEAGADCVKFQMRSMSELYHNGGDASDPSADLGAQYTLQLLSRFQLSTEEMLEVFDHCRLRGVIALCTPWDAESLDTLNRYGMPAFKVASADLTNHELLKAMAQTGKPLICSTGMSTEAEIGSAVRLLRGHNAPFALLHCNSAYPAPFKDINLAYMDRLRQSGDCVVGYSGHERGISVAIAAAARGAKIIEKHFTIDRTMEGNDHRVSLLPDEFKAMVQGIREVEQALGTSEARRLTQGELMNREVLAKSLVVNRAVRKGDILTADMISVRSPGVGLPPYRKQELVGKAVGRDMAAEEFFFPSDLDEGVTAPRPYKFSRPFGLPVRYHDFRKMIAATNSDLVEFHLSYKDLDEDISKHLGEDCFDLDLVVHSPELFEGDHLMDLCSSDKEYRERSIAELQRVIDVTRRLKPHFTRARRPLIIINAGGFSQDGPLPASRLPAMYDAVADALSRVDSEGVELIPQTMPPFPWLFGGQRYHNLFMTAEDIVAFCNQHDSRVCLDISHSQMACTHGSTSFSGFLDAVGPYAAHLHVADAGGVDGEGLQIGEGMMDFQVVAEALAEKAPDASFIPEIWQGHKNDGAGFWLALTRLEKWL